VRGISLASDDRVVGLDTIVAGGFLLTVTSQGYGKLTPLNSYPVQHRGGKGVSSFKLSEKPVKLQLPELSGKISRLFWSRLLVL